MTTARARELRASQTAAEDRVWSLLRARRLGGLKFRRQHALGSYIADFVCVPARLVIEVDGETHGEEAEEYDAKRTEAIERLGYKVVRFWNSYIVEDRDGDVIEAILDALRNSSLPAAVKSRLDADGFFDPPLARAAPSP